MRPKSNRKLICAVVLAGTLGVMLQQPSLANAANVETHSNTSGNASLILDERELLRRYLDEVERRSDVETRNELARIELQREIFREYSNRWWEQYRASERDAKVREYWQAYFAGQAHARQLNQRSAGPNSCRLVVSQVQGGELPEPSQDPRINEAYRRGMVGASPECFIDGLLDGLKQIDAEVQALRQEIFNVRKSVVFGKPDEAEQEKIRQALTASLVQLTEGLVRSSIPALENALTIDQPRLARVQEIAQSIAGTIDCDGLRDRRGRKLSCDLLSAPASYAVNRSAAYKVLLGHQAVGPYQADLRFDLLLEATQYYLREVRPTDQLVRSQLSMMDVLLHQIDENRSLRLANLQRRFDLDLADRLRAFRIGNSQMWMKPFPTDLKTHFIDTFFALKQKIEGYARLEAGTQLEENLLDRIRSSYSEALSSALDLEMSASIPSCQITVDLEDETGTLFDLPVSLPEIPRGYLMGRDRDEVSTWRHELSLDF